MKKLTIILAAVSVLLFASCDKGDIEIKRLNSGSGIWAIESIVYDSYDSTGTNVVSTATVSEPGELIFFETSTLNALFDHHLVVANVVDTAGIITANPGDVYFDGDRVYFQHDAAPGHYLPTWLLGTWTVDKNKRRSQVWTFYETNTNGTLLVKRTMNLKKK